MCVEPILTLDGLCYFINDFKLRRPCAPCTIFLLCSVDLELPCMIVRVCMMHAMMEVDTMLMWCMGVCADVIILYMYLYSLSYS